MRPLLLLCVLVAPTPVVSAPLPTSTANECAIMREVAVRVGPWKDGPRAYFYRSTGWAGSQLAVALDARTPSPERVRGLAEAFKKEAPSMSVGDADDFARQMAEPAMPFLVACDWRGTPVHVPPYRTDAALFRKARYPARYPRLLFNRPVVTADGRRALVAYKIAIVPRRWQIESSYQDECYLTKQNGRWTTTDADCHLYH
jgi:hypothetical protein